MSSNDPVEAAQYEPFLSTGSSSDSSRDDLLEINASESDDDLTVTREMFVPRFRDFSKYMPKRNENEKKEDLIYGFLK